MSIYRNCNDVSLKILYPSNKRYLYATTQEFYKKDPGTLARYIREGIPWPDDRQAIFPLEVVKEFYTDLWGTEPEVTIPFNRPSTNSDEVSEEIILRPITAKEIKSRITRIKNGSAPGPDGIRKNQIVNKEAQESLRLFYNLILVSRAHPTEWNKNRTILLPKQGKDPENIGNYRPITIGSILGRVYWGIIDTRLRSLTTFSNRQKGFVAESGCHNNVYILNELLRTAKTDKGIVVVQLDITKAFDTIPHQALIPALERMGIPASVRNYIASSYRQLTTKIEYKGSTTDVSLNRGVKQGDPLSLYIFNAIMNPLLETLEQLGGYSIKGAHTMTALAFADDLILVADDHHTAQKLLVLTERYFIQLGMTISAQKCASFQIRTTRDSWHMIDTHLSLANGAIIPSVPANDNITYLGGLISPWSGLQYKGLTEKLHQALQRLGCTSLKPHQKLNLLSTHIIPYFLYASSLASPPITLVRGMDSSIRTHVKDILHLPSCTPNGLLYCSKRDGGLGIPKLENLGVCTALKQGMQLLTTTDTATQALLKASKFELRMEKMAKSI